MRKYGVYPEQVMLFVLVILIWYAWFCSEINREPNLQQPIYPTQGDFWGEVRRTMRETAIINPMDRTQNSVMPNKK